jgi:acyl carrier protein
MTDTANSGTSAEARTTEQVRALVAEVIAELAPVNDVEVSDSLRLIEDLGYHSLALMELAFALEDEFELSPIDEQTAQSITTVALITDHVVGELQARGDLADGSQ